MGKVTKLVKQVYKSQLVRLKWYSQLFSLFIKSHILDSNGVWYCSLRSQGSINPLKPLKFWSWSLSQDTSNGSATWFLKWLHGWTSNYGAKCAFIQGPCTASWGPWGQDFQNLGGFQAPPTKTSYATPHYPKVMNYFFFSVNAFSLAGMYVLVLKVSVLIDLHGFPNISLGMDSWRENGLTLPRVKMYWDVYCKSILTSRYPSGNLLGIQDISWSLRMYTPPLDSVQIQVLVIKKY